MKQGVTGPLMEGTNLHLFVRFECKLTLNIEYFLKLLILMMDFRHRLTARRSDYYDMINYDFTNFVPVSVNHFIDLQRLAEDWLFHKFIGDIILKCLVTYPGL